MLKKKTMSTASMEEFSKLTVHNSTMFTQYFSPFNPHTIFFMHKLHIFVLIVKTNNYELQVSNHIHS